MRVGAAGLDESGSGGPGRGCERRDGRRLEAAGPG